MNSSYMDEEWEHYISHWKQACMTSYERLCSMEQHFSSSSRERQVIGLSIKFDRYLEFAVAEEGRDELSEEFGEGLDTRWNSALDVFFGQVEKANRAEAEDRAVEEDRRRKVDLLKAIGVRVDSLDNGQSGNCGKWKGKGRAMEGMF